jgi:hypothetical protein
LKKNHFFFPFSLKFCTDFIHQNQMSLSKQKGVMRMFTPLILLGIVNLKHTCVMKMFVQ